MKKWISALLKCVIAAIAVYFALRQVNWTELKNLRWSASVAWLIPAIIFFNSSQFLSAYRLLQFYKLLDTTISYLFNLRLYYTGMFYNLFLPGGIGGDVYKVFILKKKGLSFLQLTKATLLDRVTGLIVLLAIMAGLTNFISVSFPGKEILCLLFLAVIPGFLIYWLIVHLYFKPFGKSIPKAALLSVLIQTCQLLAFFCLLLFFQTPLNELLSYAALFFAGSVVAAIPVSIGGIGTRELAMATGAAYLDLSKTVAVSGSLMFFFITALSALVGWLSVKHNFFNGGNTKISKDSTGIKDNSIT